MTPYSAPGILDLPTQTQIEPIESLFEVCCRVFDQREAEVLSKSRKRPLSDVRVAFCFVAYDLIGPCPSKIGNQINTTHASAIYFRKRGLERIGNPTFRKWGQLVKQVRREMLLEI